jgi:hypothetical protein
MSLAIDPELRQIVAGIFEKKELITVWPPDKIKDPPAE